MSMRMVIFFGIYLGKEVSCWTKNRDENIWARGVSGVFGRGACRRKIDQPEDKQHLEQEKRGDNDGNFSHILPVPGDKSGFADMGKSGIDDKPDRPDKDQQAEIDYVEPLCGMQIVPQRGLNFRRVICSCRPPVLSPGRNGADRGSRRVRRRPGRRV